MHLRLLLPLRHKRRVPLVLLEHETTCPYIKDGHLVIPFNSNPKYHWWAGGQSIIETLKELNAPEEVVDRYIQNGWKNK